jgi:RNA polymerase sigma factor (sigma-70 family)
MSVAGAVAKPADFARGRKDKMSAQQVAVVIRGCEFLQGTLANARANDEHMLIAEARSGRSDSFGELYKRHRLKIYHTAFRILRNKEDAEDAAQRSFQRALANLARFREDSTFSTWLTSIAINEALMLLRQRRTSTRFFEGNRDSEYESSAFDVADKSLTPEETLARNELRASVLQAISKLRTNLRAVILLELQGLTCLETAQRLGLTLSAVKARTFHARRHLRRHLEQKLRTARIAFRTRIPS